MLERLPCRWRGRPCGHALVFALLVGFSCSQPTQAQQPVHFGRDIRPILARHCIACHGGVTRSGGLSFLYPETVLPPGRAVVVPGNPSASELFQRITSSDPDFQMPPPEKNDRLSPEEIELIRRWIEQGARWERHWAYAAPQRPPLPRVARPKWAESALDLFVLRRHEELGLEPAPQAPRLQWLRRVCFDLTGLPPDEHLIRAFLRDPRPDAHARLVDRLLASPRYGERWASPWLDLARYADSQGYEKDNLRTVWPYRDWVIRAFNADMPFDQFTVKQLAGDLLPDATLDDILATAFHRNTPTNAEGGTDDEEFRIVAVIDRVNTTWEVWQGVTFKCVQCHNHPYNPLEHREYYQFLAFFNTTRDWDLRSDKPLLQVPRDRRRFAEARALDRLTEQLQRQQVLEVRDLTARTSWHYLRPVHAVSTGLTELVVRQGPDVVPELHTEGTVSHDSRFDLRFALPDGLQRITALLVEVLPRNPQKALHTPELGFVISELKAELLVPTAGELTHRPVQLQWALGDETLPFAEAQASLRPDKPGWGADPRITHPRRLVVVPKEPLTVEPGAQLRLVIRQEAAPHDLAPLVMHRSRYAVSDDLAWQDYVRSSRFVERQRRLAELRRERAKIPSVGVPVMQEQDPWLRRVTAVFRRGNWQEKTEPVDPGLPAMFGVKVQPKDRLELARWLVAPDNPLTARVTVNRFWQELFGRGLVETADDFSLSGQPPVDQALLDYLAVRFVRDYHWSVKRLLREIVLSATYRQDARVVPERYRLDPENRLLTRGPRVRLAAEMVRDNALAISGLLANKMFGEPVMPPQPEGIWRAARSSLRWKTSSGADRYRRGIYVIWRRSSPYPSFMIFDAPQRLVCSSRRVTTNTPLQALVTLNDQAYVECALGLADWMLRLPSGATEERIAAAFRRATGHAPDERTLRELVHLYRAALGVYRHDRSLADRLGGSPERSAYALVANTILNLDEVLNR